MRYRSALFFALVLVASQCLAADTATRAGAVGKFAKPDLQDNSTVVTQPQPTTPPPQSSGCGDRPMQLVPTELEGVEYETLSDANEMLLEALNLLGASELAEQGAIDDLLLKNAVSLARITVSLCKRGRVRCSTGDDSD